MKRFAFVGLLAMAAWSLAPAQTWKPVAGNIMSKWVADVSPDNVLPEYPRPQMVRKDWQNLNGMWDYAIQPMAQNRPAEFQGKILVPFPVQSALSGVKKYLSQHDRLWYRRTFTVPAAWAGQRVLLHFGAVDWETTIWINGKKAGQHQGGYDPFSLDITGLLKKDGPQEIVVAVWDPNDTGNTNGIPRGKQVLKPKGIRYTAISGIWQTVWLEPVPQTFIASLKITPDVDAGTVRLATQSVSYSAMPQSGEKRFPGNDLPSNTIEAEVLDGGRVIANASSDQGALIIKLDNPKLWSPDTPFLYDLKVTLRSGDKQLDTVSSYFGMRKIAMQKDEQGINRLFLNNKPLFQFGPLDQGWWPDGLYTAPTDAALRYDIEATRQMGFNLARKHVKVEPERWYYWADKLGLLVWQDMPSANRNPGSDAIFEREYKAMIETHYNHPSIVMWVPFNERWGQYDTARIVDWTKKLDPTRLVDNASGWDDMNCGDVWDMHAYPGPGMNRVTDQRASVLGEFGGLGLPIQSHLWVIDKKWGYVNMPDTKALTARYEQLIDKLKPLVAKGLAAAVYTQTTDCEGEVNGLMTYDRAINKMGAEALAKINRPVYEIK